MNDHSRRLLAVAAGLLLAGAAELVLASWVLADDLADLGPSRGWLGTLTIILLLGILLLGIVLLGNVLLGNVATVLVKSLSPRIPAYVLAAVAAGTAAWALTGFLSQYDAGFPGRCTLLAALGGVSIAVGALLARPVPAGRSQLRTAGWAVGAVAVVAAVSAPLMLTAPDWRLETTTAAAGKPGAIPSAVTRVAWSTEVDGPVQDVAAAGPGAVVMLSDGVIGVDGVTGDITWSRRRAGAEAEQIDVSPDGRTVVVQMSPEDRFPVRREVLDAASGKLRFTVDSANSDHSPGFLVPMTDVAYIRAKSDQSEFYGDSLTDGHTLWTFRAPAGCRIIPDKAQQFAQARGMLLPLACGEREFRYVSVDAQTGRLRWQHVVRLGNSAQSIDFDVEHSADHELARLYVPAAAGARYTLLDTDTGKVLPAPTALDLRTRGLAVAGAPDKGELIDVRSGRVRARGDTLNCARDAGPALLSGGALCVDLSGEPFDGFMSTGTVKLSAASFGEPGLRPLTVRLGGPFLEGGSSDGLFQSAPVPGAVIAYSRLTPAAGHRSRLVGLR